MNDKDGMGIGVADTVKRAGYDYLELSLSHLSKLDNSEFEALESRLRSLGLPCESCNNFFPPTIHLTGAEADHAAALRHAEHALARAARLGAEVVVFGSSGAKNVPAGFPHEVAWAQIVTLLRAIDPIAGKNGILIAIEPLNRKESNIVNTVQEGYQLMREVNRPNIRLLVDFYHMSLEGESLAALDEVADSIVHFHIAEPENRNFPNAAGKECFYDLFQKLREIQYQGRISVESFSKNFESDAVESLVLLRGLSAACT